jgi:phosphoglycerate dehydrogenase-like enzyme
MLELIRGADACITCWGTPPLTGDARGRAKPELVAHAAGSIRHLIPPELWQTGCRVTSNAPVIAEDVAQTVLALTLTSLSRLWENAAATRAGKWLGGEANVQATRRLNGLKIGLVGFSSVCREVIRCSVLRLRHPVWDPYVCPAEMRRWNVTWMELDALLAACDVVSLHAPANPDCRHC